MGYTTRFEGNFELNKPLTVPQYNELKGICEIRHEGETDVGIGIRCKREPTEDGKGIQWNGAEKFYDYVERLNHIISSYLSKRDIEVFGQVKYQGENIGDAGTLEIKNGKCIQNEMVFKSKKICCPHCEEEFHLEQALDVE